MIYFSLSSFKLAFSFFLNKETSSLVSWQDDGFIFFLATAWTIVWLPESSFNKKNLRLVKSKPKKQKLKPQAPHFSKKISLFCFPSKRASKKRFFLWTWKLFWSWWLEIESGFEIAVLGQRKTIKVFYLVCHTTKLHFYLVIQMPRIQGLFAPPPSRPGDPKPKGPMTQEVFECLSYFWVLLFGSLIWVSFKNWVPCLDRFLKSFLYQLYGLPEILIRKYLISILVGSVILVRKA